MKNNSNSEKPANLETNLSPKNEEIEPKTINFKKTVSAIQSSSYGISKFTTETSAKVVAASKKAVKSNDVKNAVNYLGSSSKQVFTESKKIASNVLLNVSLVAIIFFSINAIFVFYGISELISDFDYFDLVLLLCLIIGGITFSGLAAYRCYKYAQFKIGLGIYHLLESFFKQVIRTSISQVENYSSEKLKKVKVHSIVKNNGIDIIKSSKIKVPGMVRKSVFLLMELIPFGDILVEIIEEAKQKASTKMEDKAMIRLDSYVANLKPHKNFTTFIGATMIANITIMSFLVYWM